MAEVVPNLGSAKAVTPTVEDDVIVVTGSRAETVRDSAATAKVAPAPTSPAPPKKQGGIGSIDSLLNDIGQNSDQVRGRNSARFDTLEQRADQQTQTAEQKKQQALASLARQHGLSSGHSSGPATSRNSGEKSAAAALPLPESSTVYPIRSSNPRRRLLIRPAKFYAAFLFLLDIKQSPNRLLSRRLGQ